MKFEITTNSPYQTEKLAEVVGGLLKGGEVIELSSELGGGKTTFTRGLANGIKSKDNVASPTFTISRVYEGNKLKIHHFDFYRLQDDSLIKHELADILKNKDNVVVIEWPNLVSDVLPETRLTVKFEYLNEDSRKLLFTYPESLSYLLVDYVNTSN
jgi:tRNA threonylcarbamoyladenosine biosynthesis protein TsaE